MSLRKSKLDLLVRVRFSNPLPPPPFPPKLLTIPTSPARYGDAKFIEPLAAETPFPMVVDADAGMPLDLSQWEGLWDEHVDLSQINPSRPAVLDPRDEFLLLDAGLPSTPGPSNYGNGHSFSGHHSPAVSIPSTPTPAVSWLRKTEYLTRDSAARLGNHVSFDSTRTSMQDVDEIPDISREAQIRDIEASFPANTDPVDISKLKHPKKPGLQATAIYEVLPDDEVWPNAYDLFKFSERPGERHSNQHDPRLDCAILRPVQSEEDHFLSYYLTQTDTDAATLKASRHGQLGDPDDQVATAATPLHFVRDYETVKIEQEVPNEFVLILDDGNQAPSHIGSDPARVRQRGAYYKNIERKIAVKKKRVNKNEVAYTDKWDVVHLSYIPMGADEARDRNEVLATVRDPHFWQEALAERQQRVAGRTEKIFDDIMGGDVDEDADAD